MRGDVVISMRKACLVLVPVAFVMLATAAYGANDFRLKPGARGELCLECHDDFENTLKNPFVHTPVKEGECTGCHSPHAANHEKLLADEGGKVCLECHEGIIPEDAVSTHKVVVEAQCRKCHDPHGSKNPSNLVKPANELCVECHTAKGKQIASVKFKHEPVEKGCVNCHNPHGSPKADYLLKAEPPGLCASSKCHATGKASFREAHVGYPVASARCTMCHSAHGSNQKGLLYDTVHEPLAKRSCKKCHMDPNSAAPFNTKREGPELCRLCHSDKMKEILSGTNVHWPVLAADGCLNCHSPHASPASGLLAGSAKSTCGKCHGDTIARQEMSVTKHVPINDGECHLCHNPHGSGNPFYLKEESRFELCGECHDWQRHVSHPAGEDLVDPRDRNLTLDCLSCHRAHGSEYQHFTHYEHNKGLCLQCHKKMQ